MFNKIAFIFLLSIKFINCGKFDYDLNQLKLHEEKGSNLVNEKIPTFGSEIKDRQLFLNQFPSFSIHLGNTRPAVNVDKPLFNFPLPNFQFGNFDEFIQPTTSQTIIEEQTKKESKPIIETTTKGKKENKTKKPELDQKIDSIKTTIPPKINLKQTESSQDFFVFPSDDEDSLTDETTSQSPIELLSTTPVIYSTTHKRIIPGLPSPDEDGEYDEDDKISNSALLSLLG